MFCPTNQDENMYICINNTPGDSELAILNVNNSDY